MKTNAFVITVEDLDTNEINMIDIDVGYPFLTDYFTVLRNRQMFDSIVKLLIAPDKHYVEMSEGSLKLPSNIRILGQICDTKTAAHVKMSLHEITVTKTGIGTQLLDSYNILMSEGIGRRDRDLTKYYGKRNI